MKRERDNMLGKHHEPQEHGFAPKGRPMPRRRYSTVLQGFMDAPAHHEKNRRVPTQEIDKVSGHQPKQLPSIGVALKGKIVQ